MLVNISIGSTNIVRIDKVKDEVDGTYVNDASSAVFVLKELDGTVLQASTPLVYVLASNGRYQGAISATVAAALTEGEDYLIEITLVGGSSTLFRRVTGQAVYTS